MADARALPRARLRLAAWNLLVLAFVLAVTLGSAVITELRAGDLAVDHDLREGAARAAARLAAEHHAAATRERPREDDGHHGGDADGDRDRDDRDHDDRHRDHRHVKDRAAGRPPAGPSGLPDLPGARSPGDEPEDATDLLVFSLGAGSASIHSNRGAPVRGLPDAAALRAALDGAETLEDRPAGDEPVRVLSVPVAHDGRVIAAVQVAKSLRDSRDALSRTVATLLFTGAAGLLLSALGSWFLAGRAMRPIETAMERQRRFIADASHELRTPVAVVRARAELLGREGDALPPAARDEIAKLTRDAEELSSLLGELLDLAHLDAAEASPELSPIALGDVVEEVAEQLAPLAAERGIALSAEPQPLWATAHLSRLRQVLRALADNALKHTGAGGHVTLAVTRDGEHARLTVTDDGEGIAPEHVPRVFDRFYRADEARARRTDAGKARDDAPAPPSSLSSSPSRGTGLGLAIAAELVRSMGGSTSLDSSPGAGTIVTVRLSLARPA